MYGINAVGFVFFIGITLMAYRLCKCSAMVRKRVTNSLCATLLLINIIMYEYVHPVLEGVNKIPVEFSSVAYFAVPLILLTSCKSMRSWAAYSGLMAGFFYYMALIFAGGPLYGAYAPKEIYLSMLCHGTLYVCGLVMLGTEAYSLKDAKKLVLGIAVVAVWAMLLRPIAEGNEWFLIYILLDGLCVKLLLPQGSWSVALPIYYAIVITLVLLSIKGFFKKNQKQYLKFSETYVAVNK